MADNPLIAALRAGSGPGLAAASGPAELRFPWMATQGAPLQLRPRAPAPPRSDAGRGPGTPGVLPTPGPVVPGPGTTPADPPAQDDSWIGTVPGISWPPSVAPPAYKRPTPGAQQQSSPPADLGPGVPVDPGFENLPIGLAWTVSPEAAGFQPPPVVDAPAAPAPQPPAEITPEAESALQDYYAQLYGTSLSYGPAVDIPAAPAPEPAVEPTWSMMPSDVPVPEAPAPAPAQPEMPADAGLMLLPLEVPADEPAPAPAPRPPRRTLPSYKDIVPDWSLDWMQP